MKASFRLMERVALLLVVLLAAGCAGNTPPTPTPAPRESASARPDTAEEGRLDVLGTILPAQRIELGFATGGLVRSVDVQVGIEVKAGDVLAELDTADLDLAVQEAEDGLALNLALLEQARASAREQELVIAQAQYHRAQAQHEELLASARPEEVASAEAEYLAALAHYEQVQSGASQEDLIVAQASLDKAEAALQRAQTAYDVVAGRPDVGTSPQAAALHEASIDYRVAKAQYERLRKLPTKAELKEAQAQLARAEAQLELAKAGPGEQEVAASASGVAIAQAQLELKEAGPRAEDVAVAEARVQQARTALVRAQLALSRSQLVAPFDGTISAVHLSPHEWAEPGVPVVELLDTSGWRVETRNVSELKIGRVQVGQEALVRVLAFGQEELHGRVVAVSPVAVVQQGDTTYTVLIELEPVDLNLRPGMNAEVEILTSLGAIRWPGRDLRS